MPFSVFSLPLQFGIGYNSFGHAAVRYTLPSGKQVVMNISGKKPGSPMVQFTTPEEYLFSTKFSHATEQRGKKNGKREYRSIDENIHKGGLIFFFLNFNFVILIFFFFFYIQQQLIRTLQPLND